jgi:hypothetical protein
MYLFTSENKLQTIFPSLHVPGFLFVKKLLGKYFIFIIFALILINILAAASSAATFTVINLNDSGAGSLRKAVADSNTNVGDDTIIFQNTLMS